MDFSLRGGPSAAADARERLAARAGSLSRSAGALLSLLLTELVTIAVRHGGAFDGRPVRVTFDRSADRLRSP